MTEIITTGTASETSTTATTDQKEVEYQLNNALFERQSEEIGAKRSLVGPHRDDITLFINNKDARRFGSQGQQRSVALALKIAEIDILRELTGNEPMLLLDDVMSELGEKRREQLLRVINNSAQAFITTTNLGYFDEQTIARAQLVHLSHSETLSDASDETFSNTSGNTLSDTLSAVNSQTEKAKAI